MERSILFSVNKGNFILPNILVSRTIPYKKGSLVWDSLEKKIYVSNGSAWVELIDTTNGSNNTTIDGDLSVTGTLTIDGNSLLNSLLSVLGNTSIGGTLDVSGTSSISTMTVLGNASPVNLSVSGNTTFESNTTVSGNATIGGNLDVTGDTTVNNLTVTGTFTLLPRAIPSYRATGRLQVLAPVSGTLTFNTILDPTTGYPSYFNGLLYTAPVDGVYYLNLFGFVIPLGTTEEIDYEFHVQIDGLSPSPRVATAVKRGGVAITPGVSMVSTFLLNQGQTLNIYVSTPALSNKSCGLYLKIFRIE